MSSSAHNVCWTKWIPFTWLTVGVLDRNLVGMCFISRPSQTEIWFIYFHEHVTWSWPSVCVVQQLLIHLLFSAATTAGSVSMAWTGFAASVLQDSPDRTVASVSPWEPEGACGGVRWAGGQGWKAVAWECEPIVSGRQIRKPFRKTVLTSPLCAELRSAPRFVRRVTPLSRGLLGEISSEKPFHNQNVIQLKRFKPTCMNPLCRRWFSEFHRSLKIFKYEKSQNWELKLQKWKDLKQKSTMQVWNLCITKKNSSFMKTTTSE